MLGVALKLLKELTSRSFKAYIVGGFVRDYLLEIESSDIDITTNATPKQIKEIFKDSCLPNEDYGSVIVLMKGVRFEITTFRKELEYTDNRRPIEVKYIDDLYTDLLRRDFTINTICMDENENIIDHLDGQSDIASRTIRCVGDADSKFNEDSLRILRAIRFATILDFQLSSDVCNSIRQNKHLVKGLSYYRKKNELDKIFSSSNRTKGIKLLLDFGLDDDLELYNLEKVLYSKVNSSIGIWSILETTDAYPFSKNELELIDKIRKAINLDNLDPIVLYKYGLYINSCAASIKDQDIKLITESYNALPIKSRDDIDIDSDYIMNLLHKEPGKYLKEIYEDLEKEILCGKIENNKDKLTQYIINNYDKE